MPPPPSDFTTPPPKSRTIPLCIIPLLSFGLLFSIFLFPPLYSAAKGFPFWHLSFARMGAGLHVQPCASHEALTDRGASLFFHSWTDEELFERAVAADNMKAMLQAEEDFPKLPSSYISFLSVVSSQSRMLWLACDQHSSPQQQQQPLSKIAFLFLTTGKLPFAPLWNEFFRGHEGLFNIYVHLDPFQVNLFNRSTGIFWGRLIPSGKTERGAPSLIAAARRLLANAMLDDPLNKYFALISDHCIPLRGFQRVYKYVINSNRSYVDSSNHAPFLHSRYVARGQEAMLPEVPFSKFRVGSQFFIVTRKHARMFVADHKYWKKFNLPCQDPHSCYAEEHYFPTVMEMEDPHGSTGYTLTYVNWKVKSREGHPKSYNRKEVTRELIVSMRQGKRFLFARKFDDDCLDVFLEISSFIFED